MTPEQVRARKSNIFTTFDTVEECINYASSGANPVICVGITANTTLELIAKEMENEKTNVD
jgi:hypothetical protein